MFEIRSRAISYLINHFKLIKTSRTHYVRGNHVVATKEKSVPKGRDHLNGIEGFWSYAKHWLYQYRGVPKKFFHLYLGEISFRFNHRDQDLFPLIVELLENTPLNEINKI